jgi:hypothetical protein
MSLAPFISSLDPVIYTVLLNEIRSNPAHNFSLPDPIQFFPPSRGLLDQISVPDPWETAKFLVTVTEYLTPRDEQILNHETDANT